MSAAIAKALHEVMSKVGYVQKTGKNAFHGYRYAGEADLLEALRPAMVEAGLLLLPSVRTVSPVDEHGNVTIIVDYILVHKDGDIWPEKLTAAGMGNDKAKNGSVGDKGIYKAITGANKYLLFKLFQIETGDDPEQENGIEHVEVRAPEQPKPEEPKPIVRMAENDPEAVALRKRLNDKLLTLKTPQEIVAFWSQKTVGDALASLPKKWNQELVDAKMQHLEWMNKASGSAGSFRPVVSPDFTGMEPNDIPYGDDGEGYEKV